MNRKLKIIFAFFATVAFMLTTNVLFAQQDENCEEDKSELMNFSILSPVQSSITDATGWARQDNGRWVSSHNRIPFTDEKTSKSKNPKRKLGQDNFIAIELRKIMIGDKQSDMEAGKNAGVGTLILVKNCDLSVI